MASGTSQWSRIFSTLRSKREGAFFLVFNAPTTLQIRRQPGAPKVDAVASHGDAFRAEERALFLAHRDAAIGVDDAVPGQVVVGGGENMADQTRCAGVDVTVRAHESDRDRTHARDDARGAGGARRFRIFGARRACQAARMCPFGVTRALWRGGASAAQSSCSPSGCISVDTARWATCVPISEASLHENRK